jgi:hypothetical protein
LTTSPLKTPDHKYETSDGGYETIPGNPGVRRFIWEHLNNFNRVLKHIKVIGGTFNGKKLTVCTPQAIVVGHCCTYEGRVPDGSAVQKIKDWPACEDLTDVRAFLGTCGVLRIFVKNYAVKSRPLVSLTRKDVPFHFDQDQQNAMDKLKSSIISSPALHPINYEWGRKVILAVDSSRIAVRFILLQLGSDKKRYPSRFGSIAWNERETRYSQAKLELFGLFQAMRSYRLWLVGLPRFDVEVDAKYIKSMLNNPNVVPNAAINRWIAGILLFDFDLVHVPAEKHVAPDGLSRRRPAPEDEGEEDDFEDWVDRAYGFAIEVINWDRPWRRVRITVSGRCSCFAPKKKITNPTHLVLSVPEAQTTIPRSDKAQSMDRALVDIEEFLRDPKRPQGMLEKDFRKLVRKASGFFLMDEKLWRRHLAGKHQIYVPEAKHLMLLRQAHDDLSHKGVFVIWTQLTDRFWWPFLEDDVKWYCQTCHQCQVRQVKNVLIPPTISTPAGLFRKVFMDMFFMPRANNYRSVVHAQCSLLGYPEAWPLRRETGVIIAAFIFEDILC